MPVPKNINIVIDAPFYLVAPIFVYVEYSRWHQKRERPFEFKCQTCSLFHVTAMFKLNNHDRPINMGQQKGW